MGSLSHRASSPPTPAISPQYIGEEDPPLLFLDDDSCFLSAGIDFSPPRSPVDENMGNLMSFSPLGMATSSSGNKTPQKPAIRSSTSPTAGGKLKKIVRFLERVEVVPSNPSFSLYHYDGEDDAGFRPLSKKQRTRSPPNDYEDDIFDDPAISSGLGRAGSPNRSPSRSPNRSPNSSSKHLPITTADSDHLSPPQELYFTYNPPSPPSWRIPPSSLIGRQPHVQEPPRVRSPTRAGEEIDLMAHDKPARDSGIYMDYSEDESDSETHQDAQLPSPPASPHSHAIPIHPVIARKMWPNGEIRFEDQWGRRLIPADHRDSFRFDLWPVEEDVNGEGIGASAKGAWVGRFRGMRRE